MMPDTKKFDGKVYKQVVKSYATKSEANLRAREIRNKGFRGKVAFARVVRSPEKEQYPWYVYVRETQRNVKRTPTRAPIRTHRKKVY